MLMNEQGALLYLRRCSSRFTQLFLPPFPTAQIPISQKCKPTRLKSIQSKRGCKCYLKRKEMKNDVVVSYRDASFRISYQKRKNNDQRKNFRQ